MNKPRYALGVDPGKKTGLAVYDRHEKKIVKIRNTDFWGAYGYLYTCCPTDYEVYIEVSRCKANWHESKHPTTSANVGGIVREANLLADGIEQLGYIVHRSHPRGKVDKKVIKIITSYEGRTNEHTRDAMLLCYGK